MSEALPIGLPFFYSKSDGTFNHKLATERTDFSFEALDFINYLSLERFKGQKIHCIINGEKEITTQSGIYKVDGYIEFDSKTFFIEYNGCRYHHCPFNCGVVPISDTRERDARKLASLQKLGTVITITGCKWEELKKNKTQKYSPFSKFYYEKNILQERIIDAIKNDEFFGFAEVSIACPEDVKEKWKVFPPIFQKFKPDFESLGEEIKPFFRKIPSEQLSCRFSGENLVLGTDMLKFLILEGFQVTELNWCLEYQKGIFSLK